MKIVLYNIGYSTGLKGSMRDYFLKFWRYLWTPRETIKKIIEFLKMQKADVVCLLETDAGSLRTRFQSQAKMVAEKLFFPFHHSSSKYHPKSWFRYFPTLCKHHDAIFSKTKGRLKKHYLKSGMGKLVMEFHVGKYSIFMVHLGLLRSNLRKRQMDELTEILKKCERPYLVCGDFNIYKGLSEVRGFLKKNRLKRIDVGATFPSINPHRTIDLIMACKSIRVKAAGVSNVLFSDHLPVWVEIEG